MKALISILAVILFFTIPVLISYIDQKMNGDNFYFTLERYCFGFISFILLLGMIAFGVLIFHAVYINL